MAIQAEALQRLHGLRCWFWGLSCETTTLGTGRGFSVNHRSECHCCPNTEGIKTGDSGRHSPLMCCTLRWMWIAGYTDSSASAWDLWFQCWTSQAFLHICWKAQKPSSGCKYTRVPFGGRAEFTFDELQPFLLSPWLAIGFKSHSSTPVQAVHSLRADYKSNIVKLNTYLKRTSIFWEMSYHYFSGKKFKQLHWSQSTLQKAQAVTPHTNVILLVFTSDCLVS